MQKDLPRKLTLPQLKKYDITQKVIEALADAESRTILFSIIKKGRTASELSKKYGTNPITISSDEEAEEYALYLEVKEEVETTRAYAEMVVGIIKQRMASATEEQKKGLEGALKHFETQDRGSVHKSIEIFASS